MSTSPSHFAWYELMTTDMAAAKAFYAKVVGWQVRDVAMPGTDYALFTVGDREVSGVTPLPDAFKASGAPPHWVGYVGVESVDATAGAVSRGGGAVHVPPTDIAGIGRFAMVADPQGGGFALFTPQDPPQREPVAPGATGHIGWHELCTPDWQRAFDFYSGVFGWAKGDAVDIGSMGTYQVFTAGGVPIGGMFNQPEGHAATFWLYYFNVGDIDAATTRLKEAGGQVLNGPMQLPDGDWIVQARDPQGAMFALTGRRA